MLCSKDIYILLVSTAVPVHHVSEGHVHAHRSTPVVRGRERSATTTRLMPCRKLGSVMDAQEKRVG
jgi:hypothetical protein